MALLDNDNDSQQPRRSQYAPSTLDYLNNPLLSPQDTSVVPPGSFGPQVPAGMGPSSPASPGSIPTPAPAAPQNPLDRMLGNYESANEKYMEALRAGPQQFHPSIWRKLAGIAIGTGAGLGGGRTGYGRYSIYSGDPREAANVTREFVYGPQAKMDADYQRQLLAAKVGSDEARQGYEMTRQENQDDLNARNIASEIEARNRPQIVTGYDKDGNPILGSVPQGTTEFNPIMFPEAIGEKPLPENLAGQMVGGKPEADAKGVLTDLDINGQNNKVLVDPRLSSGGVKKIIGPSKLPQVSPGQSDNRLDRSYQFHTQQFATLSKPIQDRADRLQRLQLSLNQNNPAADALIGPELLTAMAGGQGSGLRMNEAEISRIVGGRNNWETIKSQLSKWQTDPNKPFQILPAQRAQFQALVNAMNERIQGKVQLITQAQQRLADATDPAEHKQLLAETKRRLSAIDNIEDAVAKDSAGRTVYKSGGKYIYNDGSEYIPPNAPAGPTRKPKGQ